MQAVQNSVGLKRLMTVGALSLLFPCVILYLIFTYWSNLPILDSWSFIVPYIQKHYHQGLSFNDFWVARYSHHYVLVLMAFVSDYLLFSGSRLPILLLQVFNQSVLLILLGFQLRKLYPLSARWYGILIVIFSAFLFAPQMRNVWFWAYTLEGTLVSVFFCAAVFSMKSQYMRYQELLPPVLWGILATLSSGNGLLIWPTLMFVMMANRIRKQYLFVMLSVAVLVMGIYMHGASGHFVLNPDQSIFHRLYYICAFIGSLFSAGADGVAGVFGFVALIIYLSCLYIVLLNKTLVDHRHLLLKWLAIGGLAIGSALLGSMGRLTDSVGQALASRYLAMSAPFWCGLLVVASYIYSSFKLERSRYLKPTTIILVICFAIYYLLTVSSALKKIHHHQQFVKTIELSLKQNIFIASEPYSLFLPPQDLNKLMFLKKHRFVLFADQTSGLTIGKNIKDYGLTAINENVTGHFNPIMTKGHYIDQCHTPFQNGLIVSGSIKRPQNRIQRIVILDKQNQIRGLAKLSDNYLGIKNDHWLGFVGLKTSMSSPVALIAYLQFKDSKKLYKIAETQLPVGHSRCS